ncbi:hypothetical protein [Ruegeria arenilitoris]|uniref:hypothetical protein n=1 Tax=Ruegeria arenilitoris TaxID=1173585 RepID=UPI00147E42F5|nr:hypothetical protein [Ruegeria arenilitoris]
MINFLKKFTEDDSGAITVDWVVLTAAIVALAAIAYPLIQDGVDDLAGDVDDTMTGVPVSIV